MGVFRVVLAVEAPGAAIGGYYPRCEWTGPARYLESEGIDKKANHSVMVSVYYHSVIIIIISSSISAMHRRQ
eukprot:gene11815-8126_t